MGTIPAYPPCCSSEAIVNSTTVMCSTTQAFFYSPAGLAVAVALGVVVSSVFWITSCAICFCSYICCCVDNPGYDLATVDSGTTDATTDMKYLSMGRNRATLNRMFRLSFRQRNEVTTTPSGSRGPTTQVSPPEDSTT